MRCSSVDHAQNSIQEGSKVSFWFHQTVSACGVAACDVSFALNLAAAQEKQELAGWGFSVLHVRNWTQVSARPLHCLASETKRNPVQTHAIPNFSMFPVVQRLNSAELWPAKEKTCEHIKYKSFSCWTRETAYTETWGGVHFMKVIFSLTTKCKMSHESRRCSRTDIFYLPV